MKAAIYQDIEKIRIQEVEIPKLAAGYVLIDTKRTGICGSDLHNYFGHWKPSQTLAAGHETCGVVAEIGEGVTDFQAGDLVAVECFSHCGKCVYCRTGQYNHCLERKWVSHNAHGGFAEYTTAHASALCKLPENFSFEQGALVEPLAVSYRAVYQSKASYQDRLAIIGGGTIGQFCLAAAKAAGLKEILITVKYEHQAKLAKELGADHIVNVGDGDLKKFVRELTNGVGMDAVIETVGSSQNFNDALSIVRPRGTVVLVAGYYKPLEVNLGRIVWSEAMVTGSNCYAHSGLKTDFQAAVELITSGKVEPTKLVTHRFPLDEITEAFRVAADKRSGSIKVHVCQ